ncbi:MAG: hypothetical protein JXB48_21800 [Candidatus Latescibacteria bacterium]|nr:hypothetical protein [Candidatus Latescibacterota bacterium]
MKNTIKAFLTLMMCFTGLSRAELFNDPGTNIGKKNLVVGIEYSSFLKEYELDQTKEFPTSSERILLKVTAGLTDWFDIYLKGGGASLLLDYKENYTNVQKNYDSDMEAGVGAGARLRLLNFPNSMTRVFVQGGGFYYKTKDTIEWNYPDRTEITKREMKWADYYVGLGIAKQIDFVDLTFGVGYSQIQWWMKDTIETHQGTAVSWEKKPWRDSFETKNPVFGFLGFDFVLPYAYRFSAQAGIRNLDEAEFNISLSQGLQKD